MFSAPLRFLSIVGSLIALLSLSAFAIDQARSGSEASRAGIARQDYAATDDPSGYANPTPGQERLREAVHGTAREALDDADDIVVAPFASLSDSSHSAWARRGVPALLALVVYGFGLGFLARFASGRA